MAGANVWIWAVARPGGGCPPPPPAAAPHPHPPAHTYTYPPVQWLGGLPEAGGTAFLAYNKASGPLKAAVGAVMVHLGYDGWWMKVGGWVGGWARAVDGHDTVDGRCCIPLHTHPPPHTHTPTRTPPPTPQDKRVVPLTPLTEAEVKRRKLPPGGEWVGTEVPVWNTAAVIDFLFTGEGGGRWEVGWERRGVPGWGLPPTHPPELTPCSPRTQTTAARCGTTTTAMTFTQRSSTQPLVSVRGGVGLAEGVDGRAEPLTLLSQLTR